MWLSGQRSSSSVSHQPVTLLEATSLIPLSAVGVLAIVLANKEDSSPAHKFGVTFTLDDAIQGRNEKRVLLGVPGEALAVAAETTTSASTASATAAPVDAGSDSAAESDSVPVTTVSSTKETDGKDLPAEGAILIGADDEDKSIDDNDQRIVFIERLMGLHLSAPGESSTGAESVSSNDAVDSEAKKKGSDKWEPPTRKFKVSEENQNTASPLEVQPHPMLKYAAAAMMSRLIAAAARAQMETQAREALLLRGGAKDKDDDAEEESVPVLLASLRPGEGPEGLRSMRPTGPHMYGRPMSRSSRGPLGLQSQRLASNAYQRFLPPPPAPSPAGHPLLQQLQALQVLSALQRMQRQRESLIQGPLEARASPTGEKGTPALVMVAIPIQSQESRGSAQQVVAAPYAQPVSQYPRSFYSYPQSYPAYPAYRPMTHASATYVLPTHAFPPPPPPPPATHHYPYRPSAYAHTAPYVAQPLPARVPPLLHPTAYSHVRPVIEVPVEVPVPYHVPVPVAAYPAQTLHAHAPHQVPAVAAREEGDNSPSDSDQIVLFYDAELQNDNEHQENNGASSGGSNDDLQSSASERRSIHGGKSHHFLTGHQLPANPSANKLKLFREMMSQKHASQPGVRYLPLSLAGEESPGVLPSRGLHRQESHPQPAFIVIADDREQPQAVERRR